MPQKLFETGEKQKKAFLVSLAKEGDGGKELLGLAETLELDIVSHEVINVREKQPKFGIGSGKAEELAEKAKQLEADCLVFDWETSPTQQRNWENLAGLPVLDRQELIIQIFASRAATREAELQVQLAQLHYRLPRLTHKYIDLSQQRGGRYGSKGTGETKLETDRRTIEKQINKLEKQIEEIAKQRQVQRRQRERQGLPVCAIVGYTNAGKSSLLNALTGASVLVEDKLFATLDATTRRLEVEPGRNVLFTDTVGFIRRLPHSLVKAFRSTLEEASHACLLLHVLDASDPNIEDCYRTTVQVLSELGAMEIPVITVLNKIDRLADAQQVRIFLLQFPDSVAISAKSGIGLDEMKQRIAEKLRAAPK
ncbi:MAG: GTPase HflX [Treponema sp.]|jgi:GTP-binding protein HflX|nr:GTPase HflX [Treponema sp.]